MEDKISSRLESFINTRREKEGTINAMMDMTIKGLNVQEKQVIILFPVSSWQLNPANTMHGGLLCCAMDIAMASCAYSYSNAVSTPTISMGVTFVSGVREDDVLEARACCDHVGSRMIQTRVVLYSTTAKKVVATATGSYALNT